MATFYLDYEGGNDSNDGTTFANRWKTFTSGATAARIAPGDNVRVMGSPPVTSLGQTATWTDGPLAAAVSISSSTNATPIVMTLGAGHGLVTGDTVIVNGHTTNTNANGVWSVIVSGNAITLLNADGSNSVGNGVGGTSGTIRKFTNAVVKLSSAVTKNIALCGNRGTKTNWTASTNVTCSIVTSDYKEGGECLQISIAAGFTTGLAAYYTLPASTDFSGYQQISEQIKQTAGTLGAAGAVSVVLCSDTAGATPVDTANIPALGALNQWSPLVYDKAAALGAAIRSVAFYVNTDNGAQTFRLDNIIACKAASAADSLNLTSLISKDPGDHSYGDGYECWFGIQSINGTRVVLDGTVNSIPEASPQRGYAGTTETVTTYKRETIKTAMAALSGTVIQAIQDSGTTGSLITFSGGWNRTDMSTQTLETWFDGQNGLGSGISNAGGFSFVSIDKINLARYTIGFQYGSASANDCSIGRSEICNTTSVPINIAGNRLTATTLSAVCCGGAITPGTAANVTTIGRADSTTSGNGYTSGTGSYTGTVRSASNNSASGVNCGIDSRIGSVLAASKNNTANGIIFNNGATIGYAVADRNQVGFAINAIYDVVILGGSTSNNSIYGAQITTGRGYLRNVTINESTEVAGHTAYADGKIYSEKHDGTAGNVQIFCDGGRISTVASPVHGSSSLSWKFSPTSTNRSALYPLNEVISKIACAASALVTVSAWFRRDDTGLTAKLVCKGGQIAGVSADVSASMTAAANTWEQLTITFTPSEAGVVEIEAQFYGGTTYNGYVCDMAISQA